jgi:hypothetical protein
MVFGSAMPTAAADLPIGRILRAHLAHLVEYGLLLGVRDQIFQRLAGFGSRSPAGQGASIVRPRISIDVPG